MTKEKKKRAALIAICIVIFVILVLYIFYLLFNRGVTGSSKIDDLKRLHGVYLGEDLDFDKSTLSLQRCNSDNKICIMELELVSQGNKGTITYKVRNNDTSTRSGRLRVTIGDNVFIFPYNNVQPYNGIAEREKKEVYGYERYTIDFSSIDDYTVEDAKSEDNALMFEDMTNDDKETINVN